MAITDKKTIIAKRIAQAIRESGLSPGKLALAVGLSRQRGYAWVNLGAPTTPDDDQLERIAMETGKSVAWLRGEDPKREPGQIDSVLLASIIEAVQSEAGKAGIELSGDQLGTIASVVYTSATVTGAVDRPMVTKMVRLLA